MIYLASPYSHPNPAVRRQRFQSACAATATLIDSGHVVYSPIVHCHPLTDYNLPGEFGFWRRHNQELLEKCDVLVVLMLPGWQDSEGIAGEVQLARELGLPIDYWEPSVLPAQGSHWSRHVANGSVV